MRVAFNIFHKMHAIKTRLLILSDTHSLRFHAADRPSQAVDVVIHCGDLTHGSKLDEFSEAIKLLKDLKSPLKLAIAGNHDFTMDIAAFMEKVSEATPPLDPALVAKEYGTPGEARKMFDDAEGAGIVFLDEGIHQFRLNNGALLKVYASPYTPSFGAWGFQYRPERGHCFSIEDETDVAITHGPPRGILDFTRRRERAGCPQLFAAVAQARPRVHCFGHIHEGWGAKFVTWRKNGQLTHFTAIDNGRSRVIETLASLKSTNTNEPAEAERRSEQLEQYERDRCCTTRHCPEDELPLNQGEQTLFVNAALSRHGELAQKPWIVEIALRPAKDETSE